MTSNVFLPYILFDVLSIIIATVLVGLQYKKLQYTSTLSSTDLARAKELALLFYIHFPFFANLENDVQRKAVSKNIYLHRTNQQPMIRAHEKQRRIHSGTLVFAWTILFRSASLKNRLEKIKLPDPTFRAVKIFLL